jgi:hypothetical protein
LWRRTTSQVREDLESKVSRWRAVPVVASRILHNQCLILDAFQSRSGWQTPTNSAHAIDLTAVPPLSCLLFLWLSSDFMALYFYDSLLFLWPNSRTAKQTFLKILCGFFSWILWQERSYSDAFSTHLQDLLCEKYYSLQKFYDSTRSFRF